MRDTLKDLKPSHHFTHEIQNFASQELNFIGSVCFAARMAAAIDLEERK